jgi:HK97 family phage prohead protease
MVPVEDGGWEIAGYASTFGGSPDSYGDVVAPGAFADSIAERPTKFLYEHHTPIGKQLELREDARGLYGRWSIVDTTAGTDAYKLAKAGVLDSLSIGYLADEVEFRDDVRVLKRVTLYEVSAVALPANPSAVVTDVKRAPPAPPPAPEPRLSLRFELLRRRLARHGITVEAPSCP